MTCDKWSITIWFSPHLPTWIKISSSKSQHYTLSMILQLWETHSQILLHNKEEVEKSVAYQFNLETSQYFCGKRIENLLFLWQCFHWRNIWWPWRIVSLHNYLIYFSLHLWSISFGLLQHPCTMFQLLMTLSQCSSFQVFWTMELFVKSWHITPVKFVKMRVYERLCIKSFKFF
jgi:hypothetical protein